MDEAPRLAAPAREAVAPARRSPRRGPTATGPASTGRAAGAISLSATGDIIMGNAPSRLPAGGGKGFFNAVNEALTADLVMGNLEEPLTDDTGTGKCGAELDPLLPVPGARRSTPPTCATPASSC